MFAVKNILGKKLSIVDMEVLYTSMDNLFDYCSYRRCLKAWMLILVLSLNTLCVIVSVYIQLFMAYVHTYICL